MEPRGQSQTSGMPLLSLLGDLTHACCGLMRAVDSDRVALGLKAAARLLNVNRRLC